ncbi:MAG TPA: CocE/NonD family hydrolase [Chitinophagaceae bacterium]|nr:CocE/NonD family hydrolase [Chitinophagaceae bacterium]
MKASACFILLAFILVTTRAQRGNTADIRSNYTKIERMIPMRDGVKLFTSIYIPKDSSEKYPILMQRTPYSCAPYGENNYRGRLGPNGLFPAEKYIFVYQDVRGRHMSEGQFHEMTPAIDHKKSNTDVDESSDTYDAVEWLLKNIPNNNGKVGIYGISYPGFYASASLPNAHPAIKAVSPQAPVTDEFEGDDAYHRGAFYVMDNFSFDNFFDAPRTGPREQNPPVSADVRIKDVNDFYAAHEPISTLDSEYFHGTSKIWNEYLQHDTKDYYWQARDIRPHLKNIKPAVLVVGGWFDAEDMFGALKTYEAIEKQSPNNNNRLVMGPWTHGGWESANWTKFAGYTFGSNTSEYLQHMEFDFFNYYLKGKGSFNAGEATVFITGSNQWKTFTQWPPKEALNTTWWLNANHLLLLQKGNVTGADEYVSDPANPVPYLNKKSDDRLNEYMAADQTFASERPDVLYYTSDVLTNDVTIAGPITANLFVSMTGTDADFIVKVIDVLPDGSSTQQLVRAEVLRGKFRNSFEKPEPFVAGKITPVTLVLNSTAHTFLKGHKIMIQVQSSWFPLVDLNPQKFTDIPTAKRSDFQKSTIRIYHDNEHPSNIQVGVLK